MKRKMYFIIIGVVLLISIGVIFTFRIYEKNNPEIFKTNEQIQLESGVPVEVVRVSKRDIISKEVFTGTIEGFSETQILSDLTQKVIELKVKVGDRVSKNEIIAVLDKKSVNNMNLKYDHTVMAYNDSKIEFERMENLYKAGAVSKQTYDKAKLSYEMNKANLEAIKAAIFITSPISGIITETYVEAGDNIKAGKPVAKAVRFDKVKIKLRVNESEISKIRVGQKCLISTSSFEQTFSGEVSEVSLSANPVTRNFEVTVGVSNPDLLLRSGMFAKVEIVFTKKEGVLAIHKDAILKTENGPYVYIVGSDSMIYKREISVGTFDGSYYEVLSGIKVGDIVIIEGQNNIQEDNQKAIIIADGK